MALDAEELGGMTESPPRRGFSPTRTGLGLVAGLVAGTAMVIFTVAVRLVSFLAFLLIRLLRTTMRIRHVGRESLDRLERDGRNYILACWHGRLLMMPYAYRGKKMSILISQHGDGVSYQPSDIFVHALVELPRHPYPHSSDIPVKACCVVRQPDPGRRWVLGIVARHRA